MDDGAKMNPLAKRKDISDMEGGHVIDDLEKKRDGLVMVLGWVEGRAVELRTRIENITREISSEIRQRDRLKN